MKKWKRVTLAIFIGIVSFYLLTWCADNILPYFVGGYPTYPEETTSSILVNITRLIVPLIVVLGGSIGLAVTFYHETKPKNKAS